MSVIQISQQTTLTGRELQNAINAMVRQMSGMSPYSMLSLRSEWPSGSRLTLSAGNHMTGAIDLTFGNPSTVTAQINLLSSLAEGQRARVERDMIALANQHLPRPAGASSATPTFAPPAAPEGTPEAAAQQQAQQPAQPASQRRPFNWDVFGQVITGLFGAGASITSAYNQVGQEAAGEAIAVAQEEAGKQASPIGPNTGLQQGPGFTLGQGKGVGPDAPLPGGRPPSDVPSDEGTTESVQDVGFPTWGWVAIGLGGVAAFGALAWWLTRKGGEADDRSERRRDTYFDDLEGERDWRRNMSPREVRSYKKMSRIGKKSRKAREKRYPKSQLKLEALAMRAEGYSISDIAAALGVNRNMVKQWTRPAMTGNYGFRYYL
jgi:hypothetical protein